MLFCRGRLGGTPAVRYGVAIPDSGDLKSTIILQPEGGCLTVWGGASDAARDTNPSNKLALAVAAISLHRSHTSRRDFAANSILFSHLRLIRRKEMGRAPDKSVC